MPTLPNKKSQSRPDRLSLRTLSLLPLSAATLLGGCAAAQCRPHANLVHPHGRLSQSVIRSCLPKPAKRLDIFPPPEAARTRPPHYSRRSPNMAGSIVTTAKARSWLSFRLAQTARTNPSTIQSIRRGLGGRRRLCPAAGHDLSCRQSATSLRPLRLSFYRAQSQSRRCVRPMAGRSRLRQQPARLGEQALLELRLLLSEAFSPHRSPTRAISSGRAPRIRRIPKCRTYATSTASARATIRPPTWNIKAPPSATSARGSSQ